MVSEPLDSILLCYKLQMKLHLIWRLNCNLNYRRLTKAVAYVLCYELVFGEGLKPHGPAERVFVAAEAELKAAAQAQVQAAGVSFVAELVHTPAPEAYPRTARVNTLKWTVQDALKHLRNFGNVGWHASMKVSSAVTETLRVDLQY